MNTKQKLKKTALMKAVRRDDPLPHARRRTGRKRQILALGRRQSLPQCPGADGPAFDDPPAHHQRPATREDPFLPRRPSAAGAETAGLSIASFFIPFRSQTHCAGSHPGPVDIVIFSGVRRVTRQPVGKIASALTRRHFPALSCKIPINVSGPPIAPP